jgi:hypothetical protein
MEKMRNLKITVFVLLTVVMSATFCFADMLFVQPRPRFADGHSSESDSNPGDPNPDVWANYDGNWYLFGEMENIFHVDSDNLMGMAGNDRQYNDFKVVNKHTGTGGGRNAYVTYQMEVPQSAYYKICVYIIRHGNATPEATFYLNQGGSWTEIGSTKPDNGFHTGWGSFTTSIQIPAGTQQIKMVNTENNDWCWLGVDAMCFTTNLNYEPPEPTELTTNPYNGTSYWYDRPADDMDQIQVSIGSNSATFTATDTFTAYDLILIDDNGNGPWCQVTTDYSHSGDTFGSGDDLSSANISPQTTDPRQHSTTSKYVNNGAIINSSANFITPNCDGINDEVRVDGTGNVDIKSYDQIGTANKVKTLMTGNTSGYTDGRSWDGRGNDYGSSSRYSPFVSGGGYVMYTDGKYAGVRIDPLVIRQVRPRTLAISPNGDDTFEELKIYYQEASYSSSNTVDLYKINSDLSETYVCDQSDPSITASNPIVWTGMDGSNPRPGGYYRLKIKNSSGTLLAAPKIELLDKPAIATGNWDPDFFPLGMWTHTATGYSSGGFQDMANHNCNAVHVRTKGDTGMLNDAASKGLKCFIDICDWTRENITNVDIAPCEPQLKGLLEHDFGYAASGGMMGHNGIMGYYIADEPGWDYSRGAEITYRWRGLMQAMREIDPQNPVTWCNIGLDGRLNYVTYVDPHQLLIDVYPKYDGSGTGDFARCFNVGGWEMTWYIDQYQALVEPYGGQTWVIAQAHRFQSQLDQPNADEIRAQIWLNLAKGVKGLFFFIYEGHTYWEGLNESALTAQYNMLSQEYNKLDDHLDLLLDLEKTDTFDISVSGGGNRFQGGNAVVGKFSTSSDKYFIVANRNCESGYAGTYNNITIDSSTYPGYEFIDVITGQSHYFGDTINFDLGEGKIFKIEATLPDPPGTPQNLQITDTQVDSVSLQWQAPSGGGPVGYYNIYYGDDTLVDSTSDLTYTDSGLDPYTEYCYKITAVNAADESDPTPQQCASTPADTDLNDDGLVATYEMAQMALNWLQAAPADQGNFDNAEDVDLYDFSLLANDWTGDDLQAPTVPTGLTVDDVTESSIGFYWDASSDNIGVEGYYIYKDGDWSTAYDSTANTYYSDGGLDPNSTHTYRVSAYDPYDNESGLSTMIEETTLVETANPILDPSIELGIGGRYPWTGPYSEGDYGQGLWDNNPANARTGDASYKGTGEPGWGYAYICQNLPANSSGGQGYIKPDTNYRLIAYINKPAENGDASIRAINFHSAGGSSNYSAIRSTTTNGYEAITLDFTTSSDVTGVRIDLLWEITSYDNVWFDDVSLTEIQ